MPSRPSGPGAGRAARPAAAPAFAIFLAVAVAALGTLTAACSDARPATTTGDEALQVVATIGIVGNVVERVAGPRAAVSVLVPSGSDAHAYVPTPRDLVAVAQADAVFASGLGLEAFLDDVIAAAGGPEPIRLAEVAAGEVSPSDPHVWLDVRAVIGWTDAIATALAELDPAGAAAYDANAATYRAELEALDAEIARALGTIPAEQRALATDHLALGSFCARYGCRVVGAVIPAPSSEGSASPRHLAELAEAMAHEGARVVVVERGAASPAASRLAEAAGARVVELAIETLGPPGSGWDTYVGMMRANAKALVAAMR